VTCSLSAHLVIVDRERRVKEAIALDDLARDGDGVHQLH
jgi:hypothetical protein